MNWDIHDWDTLLHRALFVSIAALIYAGPASAIALRTFMHDEFQDDTPSSFDQWLPLILLVWLAAIPIVQAVRHWDDDPNASAAWLGGFLAIAILPALVGFLFVYRAASVLIVLPALALPFQWMDLPSPPIAVGAIVSQVVTYTLFFAVPLGALIVQLLQLRNPSDR